MEAPKKTEGIRTFNEAANDILHLRELHEQEAKAGLHEKGKTKKKQKADAPGQMRLF